MGNGGMIKYEGKEMETTTTETSVRSSVSSN